MVLGWRSKVTRRRQKNGIELIASENFVREQVMQAMGSCLTNKYAEGYPGKRYYAGCEFVDIAETQAIERACKLFDCKFANVQANSGSQANQAVYFALLQPGDKIVGIIIKGKGVTVHTTDCNEIGKYLKKNIISLSWDNKKISLEDYVGRIIIIVLNEPGSLGEIASAIGNNKGNIINLKLTSRKKTFFEMLVDVKVKNLNHFTNIIASIRSLDSVSSVNRIKGK